MQDFDIDFYQKPNGDCPVAEFLSSLNKEMRYKMMHSITMLEVFGNQPKSDFTKFVGDGIFEVRAQNKTDITRIFFFFDKNRQIVLTNGFVKKTQRMPASELETAKRYRADYLSRPRGHEKPVMTNDQVNRTTIGPKWRLKLDQIVANAQSKQSIQLQGKPRKNKSRQR